MSKHEQPERTGAGVNLSLIVTPFLDMSFQILAFFIMTYHPSHLEGHINGNLLPPANPARFGPENKQAIELPLPVPDPDLEIEETLLLKVHTTADAHKKIHDGEPRLITLK